MAFDVELEGRFSEMLEKALTEAQDVDLQKAYARGFLNHLMSVKDADSCQQKIREIIEKSIENIPTSWQFLVEVFDKDNTNDHSISQQMVDHLMCMPEMTVMTSFIDEVYNHTCWRQKFNVHHASHLLACIMKSEAVAARIKADFIKQFFCQACRKASSRRRFPTKEEAFSLFDGAKPALLSMKSEQRDDLIRILQTMQDPECENYALIIASQLGKWDLLGDINTQTALIGSCAVAVFDRALSSNKLKYMACALQKSLRAPEYIQLSKMQNIFEKIFVLDKQKTQLPQLMEECSSNKFWGAACVFALWANNMKDVKRMACCEVKEHGDLEVIITTAVDKHLWRLVLEMVGLLCGDVQEKIASKVLTRAADRCFNSGARFVVDKLLSICRDKAVLEEEVLFQIFENCKSRLFCKFVDKDPVDLSHTCIQSLGPLFKTLVIFLSLYGAQATPPQIAVKHKAGEAFTIMLKKCVEAGLSTQLTQITSASCIDPFASTSALMAAAELENFNLVKLLYRTGATSNAELYKLSHDTKLRANLEKKQQHNLQDYLDMKASNPRTLQDLCCLAVSTHIGCRADRKHRALSLELPMNLVHRVLFYDVLFDGQP